MTGPQSFVGMIWEIVRDRMPFLEPSGAVPVSTQGNGHICTDNSTIIPLGIDGIFTGAWQDTLNYNTVTVGIVTDQASAPDGLIVQWSADGTSVSQTDEFSLLAATGKVFTFSPANQYVRLVYTNGGIAQTTFNLQTIFKKGGFKASSHRISDTIVGQDDAELVTNVNKAKSLLTGFFENITSYREALNVNQAWVHRKIVNETYHQHTGISTTPSSPIAMGDVAVNFTSVAGFAEGSEVKLTEDSKQELGLMTITDITALVVTFDRPIGNDYTVAAVLEEVTTNMSAVAGTLASPQIYEVDPPVGVVWQFTRILFSITTATAPDDGKFGGIAALPNGVSLRATTASGRTVVFANWKSNGDMKLDMFDVPYTDKAPAGNHGVNGRWTFTKAEIVAELDGDASPLQKLEVLIQDDLTGLISFRMRGQGRVFSPE